MVLTIKSSGSKPSAKKISEQTVNFEFYAPLAKQVRLAGDFNGWNASKCPLKKQKDGHWTAALNLKPGSYQYRYQVDGNWENDQRPVKVVPNAFGTWNCVIEVI